MMRYISFAELQENLERNLDAVDHSGAPVVVTRPTGAPIVMLSLAEYQSTEETLHLLRAPNAERLIQSIAEANAGKLLERHLND